MDGNWGLGLIFKVGARYKRLVVLTFKVRLKGGYKGFMKGLYGVSKGFLKTNFVEKGVYKGPIWDFMRGSQRAYNGEV